MVIGVGENASIMIGVVAIVLVLVLVPLPVLMLVLSGLIPIRSAATKIDDNSNLVQVLRVGVVVVHRR